MCDRGGGREGKGKSLRTSKVQLQQKQKDEQRAALHDLSSTAAKDAVSATPPPLAVAVTATATDMANATATPGSSACVPLLMDCGAQLCNRQFDRDQLKVLQRAATAGVAAMVAWTTDFEKEEALVRLARDNAGVVYVMCGVHTDMVKRSNDRLAAQRLDQLKEVALRPETVAVMAGLDFSRDVGLRYAQERMLQQHVELAAAVRLPLVLSGSGAVYGALAEKVAEMRAAEEQGEGGVPPPAIAIYNFLGTAEELQTFLDLDCHIVVTGRICDPTPRAAALRVALAAVPPTRLLLASDAPYATPQSLADVFVREGRNEPSNLPAVLEALWEERDRHRQGTAAGGTSGCSAAPQPANGGGSGGARSHAAEDSGCSGTLATFAEQLHATAMRFFQIPHASAASLTDTHHAPEALLSSGQSVLQASAVHETGTSNVSSVVADSIALHAAGRTATGGTSHISAEPGETSDVSPSGDAAAAASTETTAHLSSSSSSARQPVRLQPAAAAPLQPGDARATYSCRSCGTTLFSELDVLPHGDEYGHMTRANFARQRPANSRASHSCSLHFLVVGAVPWVAAQQTAASERDSITSSTPASEDPASDSKAGRSAATAGGAVRKGKAKGGRQHMQTAQEAVVPAVAATAGACSEGKLTCPSCIAKVGRWATAGGEGLACACGVVVPAPAVAVQRARLDAHDAQLDVERAVQSTLLQYEDGLCGSSGEEEEETAGGGKTSGRRRAKQRRDNTANFTSFRNKDFGVRREGKGAAAAAAAAAAVATSPSAAAAAAAATGDH